MVWFKKIGTVFFALLVAALVTFSSRAEDGAAYLVLELKDGEVAIALNRDGAPLHVAQIEKLVRDGAYDNVVFHRVIEGFMAQTGDVQYGNAEKEYNPARVGMGGSSYGTIKAEFSHQPFERGTVGMARSQDPNSANSQFFICFKPAPSLNGQYTVIGQVVSGMDVVDAIKKGNPQANGQVNNPDRIIKARLATSLN